MSRLSVVQPLLRHPRYEVIPSDAIEDAVVSSVPRDVTLTVTASPTKGLEATIALAQRLSEHGFTVVPHLSARLVVDDQHLEDVVAQLRASAIDDVFVPAGDADPPAGRLTARSRCSSVSTRWGARSHGWGSPAIPRATRTSTTT